MQRTGHGEQPGLLLVLNNRGDGWNGARVQARWAGRRFRPVAWWSATDRNRPADKWSDAAGEVELWAPPRGYAVYVP